MAADQLKPFFGIKLVSTDHVPGWRNHNKRAMADPANSSPNPPRSYIIVKLLDLGLEIKLNRNLWIFIMTCVRVCVCACVCVFCFQVPSAAAHPPVGETDRGVAPGEGAVRETGPTSATAPSATDLGDHTLYSRCLLVVVYYHVCQLWHPLHC